jgi:hypothetical protein
VNLSPELRRRIYEEERIRLEAQTRMSEEIRLRQQTAGFVVRMVLLIVLFAGSYAASSHFLVRPQTIPEVSPTPPSGGIVVGRPVLYDIAAAIKPPSEANICTTVIERPRLQVRATVELARDASPEAVRRSALASARTTGQILRDSHLAVPAYVEVFSPSRWYGTAFYDSDTLKVTWEPCPANCTWQGTTYMPRCPARG